MITRGAIARLIERGALGMITDGTAEILDDAGTVLVRLELNAVGSVQQLADGREVGVFVELPAAPPGAARLRVLTADGDTIADDVCPVLYGTDGTRQPCRAMFLIGLS